MKSTCALLPGMQPIVVPTADHATHRTQPSFSDFDRRARGGESLTVAFFGASLTWGANATDPAVTSYRAVVAQYFEQAYPEAHFTFLDGAIGGTGSQLAVFRLDRDCLDRKPDLVFLDFSANDDVYSYTPETLASYESLVRRIILQGRAPVVQLIFPFQSNVRPGEMAKMKRRVAHIEISRTYNTALGDAIALVTGLVTEDPTMADRIWDMDNAHPGDLGYSYFAEVAWQAYYNAVRTGLVCSAPPEMIFADTYMSYARVRISTLGDLPPGWRLGMPSRTSAWYDALMSRWLDDVAIASNRQKTVDGSGLTHVTATQVAPLAVSFRGSMVMLYGEETIKSGKYRAYIDGNLVRSRCPCGDFNASSLAVGGNLHHTQVIAIGLDPNIEHTLRIEPHFDPSVEQELRLESICVAGGAATVQPWKSDV